MPFSPSPVTRQAASAGVGAAVDAGLIQLAHRAVLPAANHSTAERRLGSLTQGLLCERGKYTEAKGTKTRGDVQPKMLGLDLGFLHCSICY